MEEKETSFLRKNLAVIIRSIQWSYAIFWSLSATQPELLEWNEGYYNGDIKTRKTTQPSDLDSDQWGLQRSMHLRDLYISLSTEGANNSSSTTTSSSSNNNNRRPSASLSPEDLTNLEWYFLVCMSFTFRHGKCVPGRTLAIGRETWLCNVHYADAKIFSRSLLAKSASIQTIVCCPFMDGVLELGTTEMVLENPDLIKQITSSFWDIPKCLGPDCLNSSSKRKDDDGLTSVVMDGISHLEKLNSILDSNIWLENIKREELRTSHDQHSSNNLSPPKSQGDDNDDDGGDDDYDEDEDGSMEVMEISDEEFEDFRKITIENDGALSHSNKLSSLDVGDEADSNYRRILSVILATPCQNNKTIPPIFPNLLHSSFVTWKKSTRKVEHFGRGTPQRLLKKILSFHFNPTISNDEISNTAAATAANNHSINTLQYIKDLETRVLLELKTDGKRKLLLSDTNFDRYHGANKKMKAYDNHNGTDYNLEELEQHLSNDSMSDLRVSRSGKDVFIDMFCPWRECLLTDIIDQIANLQLDPQSIQSSIIDGILSLTITAKHLGAVPVSPEMIKQAIRGVSGKF